MEKKRKKITVLGSGVAGMAAAVSASRAGAEVVVIDRHAAPGGQASHVNVGTFCGLVNPFQHNEILPHPFVQEFIANYTAYDSTARWIDHAGHTILTYDWQTFSHYITAIFETEKITFIGDAEVIDIVQNTSKSALKAILIRQPNQTTTQLNADAFIDASGKAVLHALGEGQLIKDLFYQSPALVFTLSGINSSNEFQLSMSLQRLAQRYDLPVIHPVPGSLSNGKATCKLAIPEAFQNDFDGQKTHKTQSDLLINNYLHKIKRVYPEAAVAYIFPELGIRTAQRGLGKELLRESDVLNGHSSTSAIALGSWPIEEWLDNGKVCLTHLTSVYEIPAGCLCSANWSNVYFAGKTISADAKAIASARVMGTCLQTGYAAGLLAVHNDIARVVQEIGIAHARID
jgi:hypothetical protein